MTIVTMPQLGESVTEGTILKWLKQPGDSVALDESLCEIETEKVTAELPSPYEGTMGEILVPQGETVQVGVALCDVIEGAASAVSADGHAAASQAGAKPGGWSGGPMAIPPGDAESVTSGIVGIAKGFKSPAPPPAAAAIVSSGARYGPDSRERFYSPAVLRLASEHGIDLADLTGSGIGGRVTRKDVEKAIAASVSAPPPPAVTITAPPAPAPGAMQSSGAPGRTPPDGRYEVVEFSATRRTIAENLERSNLEAPQAWTMVEADVTGLLALRNREKERVLAEEGVELTLLPYFTRAVCDALREYPALNARWEGDELRHYRALDIGIAIASEAGLVVPVIHGAGDLSVVGLAKHIADLAGRARARKLRIEDIEGGTFTVDNTGAFGSITSKPIVNYPQVGIVTMERAVKRLVVLENDAVAIRWIMNVCLSFDHRALDGLEAGGFLAALKRHLESIA